MDYGTDFLLVDDDLVFTADGDLTVVEGPACIAQDIGQVLKMTPGTLVWDTKAGSALPLMLNDVESGSRSIIAELERVVIDDPRVNPGTVHAVEVSLGKFRVEFTPLGTISPEILEYDLL
jgi:hypothetical protein